MSGSLWIVIYLLLIMWNSGFNSGFGGGFGGGGFGYNSGYNAGFVNPMGVGGGAFSYNGQWLNTHDVFLRNEIDRVYAMYDRNFTGQLEGQEFYFAYRDLCAATGQMPPAPNDFYRIQAIAQQADTNFNGRIDKGEMYMLFKRCQFNIF